MQDWTPVTIHGKSKNVINNNKEICSGTKETLKKDTNSQNKLPKKIESEDYNVVLVTSKFKQDFINARVAAKKTQDQLAKQAKNLKGGVKVIKELEAGKLTMKEAIQVAMCCRAVIGIIKAH